MENEKLCEKTDGLQNSEKKLKRMKNSEYRVWFAKKLKR